MATSLVDPKPASDAEPPKAPGAPETQPGTATTQLACANCGSSMEPSQHWCLVCGAAAPGSLEATTTRRRSAALVFGITALLVASAAASAYAAWGKTSPAPHHVVLIVERPPASTTSPGTATSPPPAGGGTPTTIQPTSSAAKPPTTPATTTTTPTSSAKPTNTSSTSSGQNTATSPTSSTEGSTTTTQPQPTPLTLDTNAATTYNPYQYPASRFGDPSLAIDGDASTAWTAQVDPAVAPKMAEGLVIDMKTPQKLSSLKLITSTPGMKVQVYGSQASAVPASITDPAWVGLSGSMIVKSKHLSIKLRDSNKAFSFVALWISMAPAGSTAQSPGSVSVNEIELFKR